MEDIIAPVPKELLKAELTEDKRLRFTHRSDNEIYIVTAFDSPNVMREIGRLREIAFRAAGGGTGKSLDIDEFDTMDVPYKQLVVWNPECNDIIGGYRYLWGKEVQFDENGEPRMATAHGMFRFSEKFLNEVLPYTVELGRAFVTLEYQSTRMGAKMKTQPMPKPKIPLRSPWTLWARSTGEARNSPFCITMHSRTRFTAKTA